MALLAVGLLIVPGGKISAASAVEAPLELSLSQALQKAREENLRVAGLADHRDALLAERLQALGPDEPTLGAVGYGPGLALGPAGSMQYQVNQPFGFPGKAAAQAQSLSLQAQTLDAEIQAGLLEGDREVRRAYDELWFTGQALQLNALRAKTFTKIVNLARRRMVKGTTREVEYLRAEAALAGVENEKDDLERREAGAQAELDGLLGLPPGRELVLQDPSGMDQTIAESGRWVAGAQALLSRMEGNGDNPGMRPGDPPLLLAARLRVDADRARLLAVKRGALPEFDASVLESQGQVGGGLSMTLPIWYWFTERHTVAASLEQVEAGREGERIVRRGLELGLEKDHGLLVDLKQKLQNYKDNLVPLDEKAFQLAFSNYHFGQIDYNSLEAAANAWLDARMEEESLRMEYRQATADLEYLMGGEPR